MESKGCEYCRDWSQGRPQSTEELASIQVLMSCGCGGDVKHSIMRCKNCNSYYLASYFDHAPFNDDKYEVSSLSKEEAQKIIEDLGKCKSPQNPRCNCRIHKSHETIRAGRIFYSETIPD